MLFGLVFDFFFGRWVDLCLCAFDLAAFITISRGCGKCFLELLNVTRDFGRHDLDPLGGRICISRAFGKFPLDALGNACSTRDCGG